MSVNAFSTKMESVIGKGVEPFYVVIRATRRSSHLQTGAKAVCHFSVIIRPLVLVSVPAGNRTRDLPRKPETVIPVAHKCHGKNKLERLRFTFTPNGRREFVSRDQVFPLFFAYSLLLLRKNK